MGVAVSLLVLLVLDTLVSGVGCFPGGTHVVAVTPKIIES